MSFYFISKTQIVSCAFKSSILFNFCFFYSFYSKCAGVKYLVVYLYFCWQTLRKRNIKTAQKPTPVQDFTFLLLHCFFFLFRIVKHNEMKHFYYIIFLLLFCVFFLLTSQAPPPPTMDRKQKMEKQSLVVPKEKK